MKEMETVIAACGNDCAACPRYAAHPYEKTDEELHHTAELWMKIGYRDHVVTNEEIACYGCKPENWCRYRVIKCCAVTKIFEPMCRKSCTDEEYYQLKKAFFEKEKNLNIKRTRIIPEQRK